MLCVPRCGLADATGSLKGRCSNYLIAPNTNALDMKDDVPKESQAHIA